MNHSGDHCVDKTDNPVVVAGTGGHWCRKVSEGCLHCYAESMNLSRTFPFASGLAYRGDPPKLVLREDVLDSWRRARKPARRFVGSMTDLFGEWIPQEWHMNIFDAMAASPSQTFLLITKRPAGMYRAARAWCEKRKRSRLPANVWCGVTTENRRRAEERIPVLLEIPARIRFLVAEPLLGEIPGLPGKVDWVMIGGETGSRARACEIEWILSLVGVCRSSGIPVFVKQLGSRPVWKGRPVRLRKADGSDPREWSRLHEDLRIRQFPILSEDECQTPDLFDFTWN
ncbi:DUF5131 family protein [Staphylospora marina]|uniref:DUF5131 family protein n=1 Tax=Staphylospora marina TaxID=2490858 RepID=UPI000F5BA097|nr:DUF5131 family protein [Staphylospora marina]